MSNHSRMAQDVMSHFALREGGVGSAFEIKSFWRLELAKDGITHESLQAALSELVADGCVVASGNAYFLTQKGFRHIFGDGKSGEVAKDEEERNRG